MAFVIEILYSFVFPYLTCDRLVFFSGPGTPVSCTYKSDRHDTKYY